MHPFKKKVENKNVTIEIFVCFTGKFNAFPKKNAISFNENFKKIWRPRRAGVMYIVGIRQCYLNIRSTIIFFQAK